MTDPTLKVAIKRCLNQYEVPFIDVQVTDTEITVTQTADHESLHMIVYYLNMDGLRLRPPSGQEDTAVYDPASDISTYVLVRA